MQLREKVSRHHHLGVSSLFHADKDALAAPHAARLHPHPLAPLCSLPLPPPPAGPGGNTLFRPADPLRLPSVSRRRRNDDGQIKENRTLNSIKPLSGGHITRRDGGEAGNGKEKERSGPEINGEANPGHYRRIKSGSAGRPAEVKRTLSLSFLLLLLHPPHTSL